MASKTVSTTVSIDAADALFLDWATSINASGLFREAVAQQMEYRGIDRDNLVALVEEARREGNVELSELFEQTSSMDDLQTLLKSETHTPSTESHE